LPPARKRGARPPRLTPALSTPGGGEGEGKRWCEWDAGWIVIEAAKFAPSPPFAPLDGTGRIGRTSDRYISGCTRELKNGAAYVLYMFVNSAETLRDFYADPQRLLRRFVIRRAGEMGRVAVLLSGLLSAGLQAGKARLDQSRRDEVMVLAVRALAWAGALRRRLIAINRWEKAEKLRPEFTAVPADLVARSRHAPAERDRPARAPSGDFEPMELAEIRKVLNAPFVTPEALQASLQSVTARVVALTREINRNLAEARGQRAPRKRWNSPEDDAATLAVEQLSIRAAVLRICDDLMATARALGEQAVIEAVGQVANDLRDRLNALSAAMKATARMAATIEARMAATSAATRAAGAAVARQVAASPRGASPRGASPRAASPSAASSVVATVVTCPVVLDAVAAVVARRPSASWLRLAGFPRAASPPHLSPPHLLPRRDSLRDDLLGSVAIDRAALDTG
jgi:hypothetical protein